MNKLDNIKTALQIGANHQWGDGDYTACFKKALADLEEYQAWLDSEDAVDAVEGAIGLYIKAKAQPSGRIDYDMEAFRRCAQAAINTIKEGKNE